jgi:hypothetical protein
LAVLNRPLWDLHGQEPNGDGLYATTLLARSILSQLPPQSSAEQVVGDAMMPNSGGIHAARRWAQVARISEGRDSLFTGDNWLAQGGDEQ